MDKSLGSAIEKIKQQEHDIEAKLKAKREYEASKAAYDRSVREAISQAKKYQQEESELIKKTDELRAQLDIHKIRKDALRAQLAASKKELEELKIKVDIGMAEIQETRSSYCRAVHEVSDVCDIWALLMKPVITEPVTRPIKKDPDNNDDVIENEKILKEAIEKREKAIAERERLLAEPDAGEEFVRIKNALRYSLDMIANLRNQH